MIYDRFRQAYADRDWVAVGRLVDDLVKERDEARAALQRRREARAEWLEFVARD